ncbi:MAG: hypothetical protein AABX03_04765, partial [Nanoarchaeota archaeon]
MGVNKKVLVISIITLSLFFSFAGIYALTSGSEVSTDISVVSKGEVAYIYKSAKLIDYNIVSMFNESHLKVDFISEDSLKDDSLNGYKIIFVNDERFHKNIPVDKHNSIISNYYMGSETGLTDNDGVSKLSSREPLNVNFKGKYQQVYTSAIDSSRNYLQYYYLDKNNKVRTLNRYAGTYSSGSGSNFGDVISFVEKGSTLGNGKKSQGRICFYGIVDSDYWTQNARKLFKDCINYAGSIGEFQIIICSNNNECNDNIPRTRDICINLGTSQSYCLNEEGNSSIGCSSDIQCDDENSSTKDVCLNPAKPESMCLHNVIGNVEIADLSGNSTANSITIRFNVLNNAQEHNVSIKEIFVRKINDGWVNLGKDQRTYTFTNLSSSKNYTIFVKVVDSLDRTSNEKSVSILTNNIFVNNSTNTSNGGNSSSGNSTSNNSTNNNSSSGNSTNGGGSGGNSTSNSSSGGGSGNSTSGNSTSGNSSNNNSSSGNSTSGGSGSSGGGSSGGSGGGGGSSSTTTTSTSPGITGLTPGFSFCSILWQCGEWSACDNGFQTRTCTWPQDKCKPDEGLRPDERRVCEGNSGGGSRNETDQPATSPPTNRFGVTGSAIREFFGNPATWIAIIILLGVISYVIYYYRK